jgi:hypothetical protein
VIRVVNQIANNHYLSQCSLMGMTATILSSNQNTIIVVMLPSTLTMSCGFLQQFVFYLKKKEKEIIKEVEEKRGSKEERDSVL